MSKVSKFCIVFLIYTLSILKFIYATDIDIVKEFITINNIPEKEIKNGCYVDYTTCANGRVTELNFKLNKGIKITTYPESLKGLTSLTSIFFEDMTMSELPEIFFNMEHVTKIKLVFINLEKVTPFPSSIFHPKRKSISLGNISQMYGTLPKEVREMREIETLLLIRIGIEKITDELENLTTLKYIGIGGVKECMSAIKSLCNKKFSELKYFYITSCEDFVVEIPKEIINLKGSLKFINFSYNGITGNPFETLRKLNIERLNLSYNNFTGYIPEYISEWSKLAEFNVSGNKFEGPIPKSLGELQDLSILRLSDTNLSGDITVTKKIGRQCTYGTTTSLCLSTSEMCNNESVINVCTQKQIDDANLERIKVANYINITEPQPENPVEEDSGISITTIIIIILIVITIILVCYFIYYRFIKDSITINRNIKTIEKKNKQLKENNEKLMLKKNLSDPISKTATTTSAPASGTATPITMPEALTRENNDNTNSRMNQTCITANGQINELTNTPILNTTNSNNVLNSPDQNTNNTQIITPSNMNNLQMYNINNYENNNNQQSILNNMNNGISTHILTKENFGSEYSSINQDQTTSSNAENDNLVNSSNIIPATISNSNTTNTNKTENNYVVTSPNMNNTLNSTTNMNMNNMGMTSQAMNNNGVYFVNQGGMNHPMGMNMMNMNNMGMNNMNMNNMNMNNMNMNNMNMNNMCGMNNMFGMNMYGMVPSNQFFNNPMINNSNYSENTPSFEEKFKIMASTSKDEKYNGEKKKENLSKIEIEMLESKKYDDYNKYDDDSQPPPPYSEN